MKKISIIIFLAFFFILFSPKTSEPADAFDFQSVCQAPKKTFSDGSPTFKISFPPGGGTTCVDGILCPKISLPANSTVYSIKFDMILAPGKVEVGTPYLWVPISNANKISQIDTKADAEVTRYNVGANPSRTLVIPGGDTWVANRDSDDVTKLSPLTGSGASGGTCGDGVCGTDETLYSCPTECAGAICGDGTGLSCRNGGACTIGNMDCKEYKVVANVSGSGISGPRGVTADINGDIWIGNYGNGTLTKINAPVGPYPNPSVGGRPYGLIADQFGYVWVSNSGSGTVQAVNVNTYAITKTVVIPGGPYGIGIDKEGNILVASIGGNTSYKINGFGTGSPGTIAWGSAHTGAATRGRGIASDLNGNVWSASDNGADGTVYSFRPSGAAYCPLYNQSAGNPPQRNTVGVAVDFDNNIWVVPYDQYVLKLKPDNVAACTTVVKVAEVDMGAGAFMYNYSDMTGLRTVPKMLSVGGFKVPQDTATGAFDVCTDDSNPKPCSDPTPCSPITALFTPCSPGPNGECEVPFNIFSMQVGDYTLKNLEIIYGKQVPVTTGGLVPCGREWNDPNTPWNDTASCDFCHIMMLMNLFMDFLVSFALVLTVLAIVFTGFLFITSAGSPERKNKAKAYFKGILIGFFVIFLAWLIVDFLFVVWGYLDPLGGQWNVVCE
ncbi:MAG: hypothetical protein WA063_05590 [Minisyncoccia bacterium]